MAESLLTDLSLLFIVLVGRNFVSGICKLNLRNLKKLFKKTFFCLKTLSFFPALLFTALIVLMRLESRKGLKA